MARSDRRSPDGGPLLSLDRTRRPTISRSADRRLTAGGLALAGLFLLAAVAAAFLPEDARRGVWLPLHLTLAGGATTAIAAALPFFAASLLAAPPAPLAGRALAIGLVAGGAAAVAVGVPAGLVGNGSALAPIGGIAFVAGIVTIAWATFAPLRGSLGPRHGLVLAAYAGALVDVATGAALATLYVGGYEPVLAAWAALKPVHAWLNLFGFVSLVIAGTLLHLYPTVLGTRIPHSGGAAAAARTMVGCLIAGPLVVGLGFLLGLGPIEMAGTLVELAGALALAWYAVAVWRSRGRWTTDAGWHLMGSGSLSAGIGWFVVAAAVAFGRSIAFGGRPEAWSIDVAGAPLVVGWVVQVILGAWSHLLPSIGPGDQAVHARQRRFLATGARTRLVALQVGVAGLAVGLPFGSAAITLAGACLTALAVVAGLGLLLLASGESRQALVAALHDAGERR